MGLPRIQKANRMAATMAAPESMPPTILGHQMGHRRAPHCQASITMTDPHRRWESACIRHAQGMAISISTATTTAARMGDQPAC